MRKIFQSLSVIWSMLWSCLSLLLLLLLGVGSSHGMSESHMRELTQEAEHMFYHGYENYMKHAFPEDELRPVTCKPLTRDRSNPAHIELNDALGNYSLTLIDSLSTLAILASSTKAKSRDKALGEFKDGVMALVQQYGDGTERPGGKGLREKGFDLDSKVQVFETAIRGVGGLLSAHLFAVGDLPIRGYEPWSSKSRSGGGENDPGSIKWSRKFTYDGQLLRLAHDLAKRLLPAFHTNTRIPYPRVNLRHGVPFYTNCALNFDGENGQCKPAQQSGGETVETCSAGVGSLVLEFTTLSRLTGDVRFEQFAKKAFWAVWERRSTIGLIGSGINAETGLWTSPYTGVGAGIDSYFEYAAKSYILLSAGQPTNISMSISSEVVGKGLPALEEEQQSAQAFFEVWHNSHAAIKRHVYRGSMYVHPHYVQADLYTGATRAFWMDSLSAFYPGVLALIGELSEAVETHLLFTAIWSRFSALPERWSTATGNVEGGLGWWGGRPEFIESTYYLYRATRDPWYLYVGEMALRDIKRRCWARCGWSGLQDVRTGEQNDRMESFFLGETVKYLYLIFDQEHPFNHLDAPFVFSTEGHPLIIPPSGPRNKVASSRERTSSDTKFSSLVSTAPICPLPPALVPFTISATAARDDVFHAANLARLHLTPTPDDLDSSIMEYSRDHPSISMSDVRSPYNYTYYPWTLPLELIPHNGTSTKLAARPTFDITFPALPQLILGPGALQRVGNGILVNSMGGLRLGMVQDVAGPDGDYSDGNLYRVQTINNVALGKDEKIFMAKDVVSDAVSPLDPYFTRLKDTTMLDLVIDVIATESSPDQGNGHSDKQDKAPHALLLDGLASGNEAGSLMKQSLNMLLQHMSSLLREQSSLPVEQHIRQYVGAILPAGIGAAPIPDVEDALGPVPTGAPRGSLLWNSIYIGDENCDSKLPLSVPRDHNVVVVKRGSCSFTQKLRNIPSFAPSKKSLQLLIIVSYDDEEDGLPPGWLIRPSLESVQVTLSGLPRHHPIPMVMVGGGDSMYDVFRRAVGVGIKRRYSIQAQGVPVSNLIII